MKNKFISTILALFSGFTFGQFAVIADKDGYTNVRENGKKDSKIISKLQNGQLIYCFEAPESNWTSIDYKDTKLNGYIYKDRYVFITDFSKIPLLLKNQNSARFGKGNIKISITQKPFDETKHRLTYISENILKSIDGKKYWGNDGGMPKTEYQSIEIKIDGKSIVLPASALQNLYEPNLDYSGVNYDAKTSSLYIQSSNGDGAGGYEVIWKIENGVYKERFITYGF
ncbi:hypothetical protein N6B72_13755 [Chryseobacterium soli]|uniref:hypothetical protein n=1 Tax=Chryseobacterium soli TaxID=445961 RepID=UPI00295533F1|nr:hypothetical protein [Chryseobacterium soli]MDV7697986.1 hypothetical protein [Chryseobacterium soli]